ncbi:unnamed protein product [Bursaphelenchus xylophilus]|uniref:(pine wood nematode) hypothetical protein n=1 Tax=Bursaphelenchus xylophilus TaxID=6326 RepID=A0A7I8WZE0_BURXY|nr:unnamed protein product [Bursaphelenchus xylophilus]CAG9129291.1 unnamed protein product [Bursaphelenchus xylophilus]
MMVNYTGTGLVDPITVLSKTNCTCQPGHYCFRMKGWRYPQFCLPSWYNPAETMSYNIEAEIERRNTLLITPGVMMITIIILVILIIFLVAGIGLARRERFIWTTVKDPHFEMPERGN